MKKRIPAMVLLLVMSAFTAYTADFNVELKTDNRVFMDSPVGHPEYNIYFNRNDLVIKVKQETNNMKGYAEADLISWGQAADGVMDYGSVQPYELRLNEAYAGFYGVFFDFLDITAGKQVVSWGSADKLNQLDILTPYDFSDILDFNKRLGVNMLRVNVNAGPVTVEGVYIPVFTPALLSPALDPAAAAIKGAAGLPLLSVDISEEKPALNINNAMYAARTGFKAAGVNMHLSYFNGYLSLPAPSESVMSVAVTSTSTPGVFSPVSAALVSKLKYPKVQLIGADAAASLFTVGVWAEAGVYVPEKFNQKTGIITMLDGAVINTSETEETVLEDVYVKYTVGADYTFGDGTYANLQFMHGFFNEYGGNLSDLFMGRVERTFFDDKLKLAFGSGVECDFNKSRNMTPGVMLLPAVTICPFDSTEIEISGLKVFANGKNDGRYHLTNNFTGLDQLAVKAKYSF